MSTPPTKIPTHIAIDEGRLETAFWAFDTDRKLVGMERDAFKRAMRQFSRETANNAIKAMAARISEELQSINRGAR